MKKFMKDALHYYKLYCEGGGIGAAIGFAIGIPIAIVSAVITHNCDTSDLE